MVLMPATRRMKSGYESVSQFSREYSRFFGQPPMRDIKSLRDGNVAASNVA
jgi:AraC-like DNA-binding protein